MEKKEIIFVIGNYKNGGVPMRATNLANEFGKKGYKVTILVTKEIGDNLFFKLHENVKLISLSEFYISNKNDSSVQKDQIKQEQIIRMYKWMRYITRFWRKVDIILEKRIRGIRKHKELRAFFMSYSNAIVIPFGIAYYEAVYHATRNLKCNIIYAERNAPELEFPEDKNEKEYLFYVLKKGYGIVVQTENEKNFYKAKLNSKIYVVHNPIKKNLPQPFEGERRKIVVNFCRISEQKNLKLLINSFVKLRREYPEYVLRIYGNVVEKCEEILRNELEEYIVEQSVEEYVHILPPAADVHNKVRDCAMFVSSSDYEGLSNSMIEAMAIGMPCVCTDCLGGGAREMIIHGENGILVPIKDEEALYQGMKIMVDNPKFAQKCGRNASGIREDMNVEKIADEWIEIIENI